MDHVTDLLMLAFIAVLYAVSLGIVELPIN